MPGESDAPRGVRAVTRIVAALAAHLVVFAAVPASAEEPVAESPLEMLSQRFLGSGDELGRLTPRLPQECGVLAVVILSSKATARGAHLGTVEALRRASASADPELAEFARGQAVRVAAPLASTLEKDLASIAEYREQNEAGEFVGKDELWAALDHLVETIEETRAALAGSGDE